MIWFAGTALWQLVNTVFIVALVWRLALAVRAAGRRRHERWWRLEGSPGARLLDRRFADGSITEAEYRARRAALAE